jgi:hypothetical protein
LTVNKLTVGEPLRLLHPAHGPPTLPVGVQGEVDEVAGADRAVQSVSGSRGAAVTREGVSR